MIDDLWDLADAYVCLLAATDQVLTHVPGYSPLKSLWLDIVLGPPEALESLCTRPGAAD